MNKQHGEFLVLYGSQTGQSKAISEILVDKCQRAGLIPKLFELNDFEEKFHLENEPLVVVICSSTGSGEPPDNAERFVTWISRRNHPTDFLEKTNFAILGLGDSNYTTYQAVPISLEKNFLRLGAKKILDTGAADDQIGLELVVEPWLDRIISKLIDWFQFPSENFKKLNIKVPVSWKEKEPKHMDGPESMSFDEEEDEEQEEPEEIILKASKIVWPTETACLLRGSEEIVRQELQTPVPTITYLASSLTHEKFDVGNVIWQNGFSFPGATNEIIDARVVGTMELTKPDAFKTKREIYLDIGDAISRINYEPGDAFYFIVPNPREEVNLILERMNLLAVADQKCFVRVHPRTEKRNASMPGYIPEISSLRYIFTYCLDIRRSPSRPLLRWLSEQTKDEKEKRRLLELSSVQGTEEFTKFVRQAGISLADLLFAFPSCQPSADRLMELLPRLQPRPYSVACSKAKWGSRLRFVYSLMSFSVGEGRQYHRYGLASGWLTTLRIGDYVKVMFKEPTKFRLPPPSISPVDVRRIPLIMVGPGTGVTPFLSFLEKIYEENSLSKTDVYAERELYFGCRSLDLDYICRNDLEFYEHQKILSYLEICESQPIDGQRNGRVRYVQNALLRRGKYIAQMLTRKIPDGEQPVRVFVCGNAKGMAHDVWAAFIKLITENTEKNEEEAKRFMEKMKKEDRYLEDVWA